LSALLAEAPPRLRPSESNDYAILKRRIAAAGLLAPRQGYYWFKSIVAVACIAAGAGIALTAPHPAILLLDAIFMGFASTQVGLVSHDIGHRQAYRGRRKNLAARSVFGNLLIGVSHTWWNRKHNAHHANPNHIDMDPDIQIPFMAFSADQIPKRKRWARPIIAVQVPVILSLLPFQAVGMRITSIQHLVGPDVKHRWLESALIAVHFAAYGVLLYFIGWPWALPFAILHQGTFGLYNATIFASNHKGMPFVQDGTRLDFLREQVLTSRNVSGHPLTDFWYGGLNYQIEHHLFPNMPRCNLRKAQPIVEAFCRERDIEYYSTGLLTSYREVATSLHREGASLRRRSAQATS